MPGERKALIVANDEYEHPGLQRLWSAAADAEALAGVLGDPGIGGFAVEVARNRAAHDAGVQIEDLFSESRPDDVLLLHFSCHGLKDESGELYFATRNTRPNRLGSTAISAAFVQRCMRASRSRSIVLLLDCCYGGAFSQGVTVRASGDVNVLDSFPVGRLGGGRGRAVISASSSIEYAFEGDQLAGAEGPSPSVFTAALVEGLASGNADRDEDGWISLNELYDYVFDKVRERNPHQTPSRGVEMQGELYLARSRRRRVRPADVPADLRAAMTDANMFTRLGAVTELRSRLVGDNLQAAAGAFAALTEIADGDIQYVAEAARAALHEAAIQPDPLRLHFGQRTEHRTLRLLGPPLARACAPDPSDPWIRVTETEDGFDVSVAASGAGAGYLTLRGPTGEVTVPVEAPEPTTAPDPATAAEPANAPRPANAPGPATAPQPTTAPEPAKAPQPQAAQAPQAAPAPSADSPPAAPPPAPPADPMPAEPATAADPPPEPMPAEPATAADPPPAAPAAPAPAPTAEAEAAPPPAAEAASPPVVDPLPAPSADLPARPPMAARDETPAWRAVLPRTSRARAALAGVAALLVTAATVLTVYSLKDDGSTPESSGAAPPSIRTVAFRPDGKMLATGSDDGTIQLWDPATGKPIGGYMGGASAGITSLAFSPDDRLLANASTTASTIRLWNPATRQPVGEPLTGHPPGWVASLAFSPDGKMLASGGTDGAVRRWNPSNGQPITQAPHPSPSAAAAWVTSVAFSPDGKVLASGGHDETVRRWDPATGELIGEPFTSSSLGSVSQVGFSPDGKLLFATDTNYGAAVFDATTGEADLSIGLHLRGVGAFAFSPDGKLFAGAMTNSSTVRLWDPARWERGGRDLAGPSGGLTSLAFSPDGKILAVGAGANTVRLWNTATGQPILDLPPSASPTPT